MTGGACAGTAVAVTGVALEGPAPTDIAVTMMGARVASSKDGGYAGYAGAAVFSAIFPARFVFLFARLPDRSPGSCPRIEGFEAACDRAAGFAKSTGFV